jgi:predicted PurR-regulated permease PerM
MSTPRENPPAPPITPALTAPPNTTVFTPRPDLTYTQKVLIAVTISVAALLLTAFVYYAADILVLCFAGLLLAVFLSAPSELLAKYTRISRTYALLIVLLSLIVIVLGGSYFMGYTIYKQSRDISQRIPTALALFEKDLHNRLPQSWFQQPPTTIPATTESATTPAPLPTTATNPATVPAITVTTAPAPEDVMSPAEWLANRVIELRKSATDFFTSASFVRHAGGLAGGVVTSTFGLIGNAAVVFGVGLFFALTPRLYILGLIAIFPMNRRPRVAHILAEVGNQLQWWFVGQLCSMASIGLLTTIGLAILGVPGAITLGILAGLLNFIPNFGPILAAIPAILVAFAPHENQATLNPSLAGWVLLMYIIIQLLEGWVITPFFQKRAVELPPALIVIAQMLFALMLGPIGLILATPILAAVLVLLSMTYIEDILGDRPPTPTPKEKPTRAPVPQPHR